MKFASFLGPTGIVAGVVRGAAVVPLDGGDSVDWAGQPTGLLQHIGGGREAITTGTEVPLDSVELVAPIPVPRRNIICVGQNYVEHSIEFDKSGFNATAGKGIPDRPVVFTKAPTTVIGPEQEIPAHDELTQSLDYEAELAVIIGREGRDISPDDAMSHVWGYTIINDVTARDIQHAHRQWFLGKSKDGLCPMGPFAVTADEVDYRDMLIETRINGELRQSAKTVDLIFDIPELIATISAGMTLVPGDIIATGTPPGVGIGFDPPRFLRAGDVIEMTITGLGTLVNTVGAAGNP
ncbi:2-keto-4-pentenoate hydratase/2-oxohepta-3-ene-1,7-dioic acid hydratase (catechol pathway) [Mycolicibacterium rutilum]|uniref:2-keto-4-pentenoate hydratase/2-oxohepta-3-ene-1,7-dioic acid hydratase (Catechol pathway) n=1 Tax=Mycolicibacterium rutilum TaxID=370526 RepID=A0A1H6IJA0_MYCRU|nr:fumarylacetoacetate hydrolase family protein [Mycolicibacterium rutilum]SEH47027.1 2-keto-4-pentenoate hydratase/2-oxohepta-3-ene-1,7-dioic acid hydratase (catechol pathway) [Mycolicibacterium rutilum]